MKIKLPTALRSALLAAMALTAGTAYAAPFDPSVSPGTTPGTTVNGLLVGDSTTDFKCDLPNTVTTVRGDVVVGAGNRSQGSIQGGDGILNIAGSLKVTGSIYAGASGIISFENYVDKQGGGNGEIGVTLTGEEKLEVGKSIRLGWLDGKNGTMSISGGKTTVGGQIVLGFYNEHGGLSLGTTGRLFIHTGAQVTASREIFVASGSLTLQDQDTTLTGVHLELVGRESSKFLINGTATARFNEILIGSYGGNALMEVTGENSKVTTDQNFQIYAGTLELKTKGVLDVTGHAVFGNNSEGEIDSHIIIGDGSVFSSRTLSVKKDAELLMSGSGSKVEVDEAMQIIGEVNISSFASLVVGSDLSLKDGATISIDSNSLLKAQNSSTQSDGEVHLSVSNKGSADLGNLTIASGNLTVKGGEGWVDFNNMKTEKGNLIVDGTESKTVVTNIGIFNVAAGTSVQVQKGVLNMGAVQLSGNLLVADNVTAQELNLKKDCGLTVASTGKLSASSTIVGGSMTLENTGNKDGTLGDVTFADGVNLTLKDKNTITALTTKENGNNTVTVSGEGNKLGVIDLDKTSTLLVKGTKTEVSSLTSEGTVAIDSDLTMPTGGSLLLKGTTTISGSLTAASSTWNTGSAPVTLLINGNTKSSASSAMLQLASGVTSDSFNVEVDMTNGISGLSGKQVVFAKNGGAAVSFSKVDGNFKILGDGTITEVRDTDSHVIVEQMIGSTKTTYGYTFNGGAYSETVGINWQGTGITFDNGYKSQYVELDENNKKKDDSRITTESVSVGTTTVQDKENNTYAQADFSSESEISGDLGDKTKTLVTRNISTEGGTIRIEAEVAKRVDATTGETKELVATGAKTWVVNESIKVGSENDKSNAQIGGLGDGKVEDGKGNELITENISQLNISANKQLEIEGLNVHIDHTLSMEENAVLSAKGAKISIGQEILKIEENVVMGNSAQKEDGTYESIRLSDVLNQKQINNVTLNLEDSQLEIGKLTTSEKGNDEGPQIINDKVVFNNATIITTQTEGGKEMTIGSAEGARLEFNNSDISGTGTLNNIVMNGGTLMVGNSPGTRITANSSYNSAELKFFIDPSQVKTDQLEYGIDGGATSLLVFGGDVDITGLTRVSISMQLPPEYKDDIDDQTFTKQYSAKFIDGMSFQVIDKESLDGKKLTFTGTLVDGSLPTLQDGLVWDYNSLFTDGQLKIAKGSYADAVRIANTLVSAGETVSGFGQMSRSHVYDVRLNGTNVWANGVGTFLNHSGHNGRSGFDYNAGGYAVGADTIVDDKAIVGVAFGQSFGKQTPKAGNRFFDAGHIDMDSLMFGLYGGTSFNMKSPSDSMKLDAYASYGRFDNDSTRRSLSGNQTATASWKENAYAVGATLTRVHEVRENLFFSPFASLDYTYADMDSFTETAAQDIRYEGSAYQNLSLTLGTGLTRVYRLNGGQELSPFVSVAYVGDLVRKDAKVTSKNATGALIERSVSPGRNAFQVNVGTGWKITEQWGARVGYTAEFRSGATDQGVNVGVSYAF